MSAPPEGVQLSLVPPPEEEDGAGAAVAVAEAASPHPPTPEQAAAIEARDRDVFLEAGAGTGKTRVLVSRYCDAVDLDGVEPERILAFTFTERAAAEMRRRVRIELARRAALASDPERRARLTAAARAGESTPITTIHGFCRRLLAAHPVAAGLDPRFRVLDAAEASRLAAQAYDAALAERAGEDPDLVRAAAGYRWRLAGIVRAAYGDLRNRGHRRPQMPAIQIAGLEGTAARAEGANTEEMLEQLGATYEALRALIGAYGSHYEELCAARSGVDFDDLQLVALELLRTRRAIAEAQQERFDHLLVDEFQDTSPLQVELVRALAGPATRLFAVGDEFQSIYAFRGADLDSFRRERDRLRERAAESPAEAAVLPLSGSFRSDPDIVAAVNAVGSSLLEDFRPLRVGRLPAGEPKGPPGPTVELLLTRREGWNEPENWIPTARHDAPKSRVAEARFLAARLRDLADAGAEPAGMVVLLRAFSQVDVYAEALERAGLDPHVVGGRGYWSAQQVADALRLLACVANPLDDESLLGALASPACGASPDALWMLRRIAGRRLHLWPALDRLFRPEPEEPADAAEPTEELDEREIERRREAAKWSDRLPEADRERLARFHAQLVSLRAIAPQLPLDTLVERTLEAFGYDIATLLMEDGRRRTANLRKLVRIATEYEAHDGRDLRGFLDHAASRAAFSDREAEAASGSESHAGVRVMTVHAAKGLEFETVAVADLGRKLCLGGQPPEIRIDFEVEARAVAADDGPPPARVGLRLARAGAESIDTEGYKQLNDDAADAEAEESGRLVYVAASRAQRRLILSGVYDAKELEPSEKPRRSRSALGCLLPALGVEADDEGALGASVEIPAPDAREGLEATFAPATVAIRAIGAGAESVAMLSADRRSPSATEPVASGGRPPLLTTSERGAAAARTLSYAALADYRRCGYRFLTERVLGLGPDAAAAVAGEPAAEGDDGAGLEWDEEPPSGRPATPLDARAARMGFGRGVHDLLEWSARNGWSEPTAERAASVMVAQGSTEEAAGRARQLVGGWLGSELLAELRAGDGDFRAELPFRLALGERSILRGTIDLLVGGKVPTIVDYKTDSVADGGLGRLEEAYELQRSLYAAAVAEATGAETIRSAYVFLQRPEEPLITILNRDEIAAGRDRIEALLEQIRGADFQPTPTPHAGLCHDCPARPRLCSHPPELTMRPEPQGA